MANELNEYHFSVTDGAIITDITAYRSLCHANSSNIYHLVCIVLRDFLTTYTYYYLIPLQGPEPSPMVHNMVLR